MLNYIWAIMIMSGTFYAMCTGRMEVLTEGMLDSSKEAVSICIVMLGIVSLWSGIMEIATRSGIIDGLTRGISPVVRLLFPNVPVTHPACRYISANFIANIMGLGMAATPAGLKAMEELSRIHRERTDKNKWHIASDEMCIFLIINISSLQLIPVNIIAYRSQYGSVNPARIIGPGMAATLVSTLVGVIFCKIICNRR